MMQHFVIFVTILVCGEIFQQTPAADLEHFANDIDHRNIGALDSDEKGIRQLDCSDKYPAIMKKNKYCQKLPQDCLSVSLETDEWNPQKMCSLKFSDAICTKDDCKKDAGKCKKALKTDAKKRLSVFCPTVCDMRCAATCTDGIMNQDETEIDCGGLACPACEDACCDDWTNPECHACKEEKTVEEFCKGDPDNAEICDEFCENPDNKDLCGDYGNTNTCEDAEFWCDFISNYECRNEMAQENCRKTCNNCVDERDLTNGRI